MEGSPKSYPSRKNLRLPRYDYSQAGAYFVTLVTQERVPLFGAVVEGEMRLNEAGEMIATVYREMPHSIPNMEWGITQIMPNHFHAIIELINGVGAGTSNAHVGAGLREALFELCLPCVAPCGQGNHGGLPLQVINKPIPLRVINKPMPLRKGQSTPG